jgi:hypothetical protein
MNDDPFTLGVGAFDGLDEAWGITISQPHFAGHGLLETAEGKKEDGAQSCWQ